MYLNGLNRKVVQWAFEMPRYFIDFWGGAHGNFLELAVNSCVFQQSWLLTQEIFVASGAVHVKNKNLTYAENRNRWCRAEHLTQDGFRFAEHDRVIRIKVPWHLALICFTNATARAGTHFDKGRDIWQLENHAFGTQMHDNVIFKSHLPYLQERFGKMTRYPRYAWRHLFYNKFRHGRFSAEQDWDDTVPGYKCFDFDFASFFDRQKFYRDLQEIAVFFDQTLMIHPEFDRVYDEFLEKNQGWRAWNRCQTIIAAVQEHRDIRSVCTVIDEAYLEATLDLGMLNKDKWPTYTRHYPLTKKQEL